MTTRRRRGTDRNERTRVRSVGPKKKGPFNVGEVPSVTPLLILFQFFWTVFPPSQQQCVEMMPLTEVVPGGAVSCGVVLR